MMYQCIDNGSVKKFYKIKHLQILYCFHYNSNLPNLEKCLTTTPHRAILHFHL